MLNNGPWSFDNVKMVLKPIKMGEDPMKAPLNEIDFWIQIYDLPSGLMTEQWECNWENFFGSFIMYDPNNNKSIWREYMHVKIRVDARCPLKRKEICRRDKSEFIVHCEYAKLGDFQFLCEMITQTERFFRKKPEWGEALVVREWGSWLRAPSRRGAVQERSKWLRDDGDDIWGEKRGEDHVQRFKIPNLAQDGMRRDKEGLNFGNQADILGVFNLNWARKINK